MAAAGHAAALAAQEGSSHCVAWELGRGALRQGQSAMHLHWAGRGQRWWVLVCRCRVGTPGGRGAEVAQGRTWPVDSQHTEQHPFTILTCRTMRIPAVYVPYR